MPCQHWNKGLEIKDNITVFIYSNYTRPKELIVLVNTAAQADWLSNAS